MTRNTTPPLDFVSPFKDDFEDHADACHPLRRVTGPRYTKRLRMGYKYTLHSPCGKRRSTPSKNTFNMAQKNNSPHIIFSRAFAQLGGSTKPISPSLAEPLATRTKNFEKLGEETHSSLGTTEAPVLDPEATRDKAISEHPLAWDVCPNCQLRGEYRDMFHCTGCEKAFHPLCISAMGVRKTRDPRYYNFLCPGCAEDNMVLQLLASDE